MKNISTELDKIIKDINAQIEKEAYSTLHEVLQEIKPLAQKKIEEIILEKFYNNPMLPESEYYDRTMQFLKAVEVKTTQGGGYYTMSLYYNLNELHPSAPASSHKFWSYAYSYGRHGSLVGTPLSGTMKLMVVDNILDRINSYNFETVEEAFQNWVEDTFPKLFEKKFSIKSNRFKQGNYTIDL